MGRLIINHFKILTVVALAFFATSTVCLDAGVKSTPSESILDYPQCQDLRGINSELRAALPIQLPPLANPSGESSYPLSSKIALWKESVPQNLLPLDESGAAVLSYRLNWSRLADDSLTHRSVVGIHFDADILSVPVANIVVLSQVNERQCIEGLLMVISPSTPFGALIGSAPLAMQTSTASISNGGGTSNSGKSSSDLARVILDSDAEKSNTKQAEGGGGSFCTLQAQAPISLFVSFIWTMVAMFIVLRLNARAHRADPKNSIS